MKRKGRKEGRSADSGGCGIGDHGTEVFVVFARFVVPCSQPRITRILRMTVLVPAINATFLPRFLSSILWFRVPGFGCGPAALEQSAASA